MRNAYVMSGLVVLAEQHQDIQKLLEERETSVAPCVRGVLPGTFAKFCTQKTIVSAASLELNSEPRAVSALMDLEAGTAVQTWSSG